LILNFGLALKNPKYHISPNISKKTPWILLKLLKQDVHQRKLIQVKRFNKEIKLIGMTHLKVMENGLLKLRKSFLLFQAEKNPKNQPVLRR
jgi:Holliday junction resolvasome RuvABC ATP-dependent DNA helicase subunit